MTHELKESPSQTAGPYVHIGLMPQYAGLTHPQALGEEIVSPAFHGDRIRIEGIVRDGNGDPVSDILIETWQADPDGEYHTTPKAGFRGWGRVAGDFDTGEWAIETVKPGGVNGAAPHIQLWLVARGINIGLSTRFYFGDEEEANAADPVLQQLDRARQITLIAQPVSVDETYRFEINLQGNNETVFFDV
jgi:protocatechuate 3,4-dioxygenase alpha subunit